MLTADIIKEELRVFVRQHFKDTVNEGNRSILKKAWDEFIDGEELTTESLVALRILNISPEKREEFITSLGEKYGHQFTAELAFSLQITAAFALKGKQDAHVLNFGHFQPKDFFEEDVPAASLSGQGLFAENQGAADVKPANMSPGSDKK